MRIGTNFKHRDDSYSVKVLEIYEDFNILKVCITSERNFNWYEDWNLAHTYTSFNDGTYIIDHK